MLRRRLGKAEKRLEVKTPVTLEKSRKGMSAICVPRVRGIESHERVIQDLDAFNVQRVVATKLRMAPPTMSNNSVWRCAYLGPRTKRNSLGRKAGPPRTNRLNVIPPPTIAA